MTNVLQTLIGVHPPHSRNRRTCRYPIGESDAVRNIRIIATLIFSALASAVPKQIADVGVATKILALEHAWNEAEEHKDTKAMDGILDNSMVYVDYDGSLLSKADFLAKVKAPNLQPQQEMTESMTAHIFGGTAVVTGVYVAKGLQNGKPYTRRGRFTDTWALKDRSWVCVASQATPILR